MRAAASLGPAAGLGEAIIRLGRRHVFGHPQIYSGLDIVWMAPLANLIVFLLVAIVMLSLLALGGRRLTGAVKVALVIGVLVALAVWSLTERVPQIGRRPGAILGLGAGVFAAQQVRRRGGTRLDRALVPLGIAVTLLGGSEVAARALAERRAVGALPPAPPDAPNVLLLILDTVRAQSTSLYGHQRRTTPVIDAVADSGVRFSKAYATAPWTLPSHGSIFTGRYAHELSVDWLTSLDAADLTIAERFRDAGYLTGGFVGNYMVSHEPGVARGFVHYEDFQRNVRQLAMSASLTSWLGHWTRLRRYLHWHDQLNRRSVDAVNAGLLRWIGERRERPYFAFVNYFDAHEVYLPPPPFNTLFGPDSARKNWHVGFHVHNGGMGFRTNKKAMRPHEVQAELDAYEAALAHVDSRIGALLDTLAAIGALHNTIVVVTSDHGEHFGEHGEFNHGASLYPQVLHVPLVIRALGRVPAAVRVREWVTLRDLAATIEHLALGTTLMPGSSLESLWDSDSTTRGSAVLASRTIGSRDAIPDSVRHGAWASIIDDKLVIEFVGGSNPATEIFDLRADSLGLHALPLEPNVQQAVDSARKLYHGMRWKSQQRRGAGDVGATRDSR